MNHFESTNKASDVRSIVIPPNYAETASVIVDTDFLIVGAGPAGASLACFLGKYGKTFFGIMVATRSTRLNISSHRFQRNYYQFRTLVGQYAQGSHRQSAGIR
jgi:cation diffusion facilitator CzcD-associated flavoprotein CzcO